MDVALVPDLVAIRVETIAARGAIEAKNNVGSGRWRSLNLQAGNFELMALGMKL